MYLDTDNRPPITPQLAWRVAVIGGFALVMFAVIFFRLWYLQILSGDKYLADANNNRVREIKVEAPRGVILDRDGRVLVDNRVGLAVKVRPDEIPPQGRQRALLFERLGETLGMKPKAVRESVETQLKAQPFVSATVKQDVAYPVVSYLAEHGTRVPGCRARGRLPARVPAPRDRRAPLRDRRRGDRQAARRQPLPRRFAG